MEKGVSSKALWGELPAFNNRVPLPQVPTFSPIAHQPANQPPAIAPGPRPSCSGTSHQREALATAGVRDPYPCCGSMGGVARHHCTKVDADVVPGEVGSPRTAHRSRGFTGAKDGTPPPPEHTSPHKGRYRLVVVRCVPHSTTTSSSTVPATGILHWPGKRQRPCSLVIQGQTSRETRGGRTLLQSPDGPRGTRPLGG